MRQVVVLVSMLLHAQLEFETIVDALSQCESARQVLERETQQLRDELGATQSRKRDVEASERSAKRERDDALSSLQALQLQVQQLIDGKAKIAATASDQAVEVEELNAVQVR
jgi:chromosome segregation ATPase